MMDIPNLEDKSQARIENMVKVLLGASFKVEFNKYLAAASSPVIIHISQKRKEDHSFFETVGRVSLEYLVFILVPKLLGMNQIMVNTSNIESVNLHIDEMYRLFCKKYHSKQNIEETCQQNEMATEKEPGGKTSKNLLL